MISSGDKSRLAQEYKSRTLASLRMLITKRHYFQLPKYLSGCTRRSNNKRNALISIFRLDFRRVSRVLHLFIQESPSPRIKEPPGKYQFSPSLASHVITGRINSSIEQSLSSGAHQVMGSCSRLLPKDVALAGKSNSSTGDENDSVELEYNNIAYIVIFLFSFLISEFSSLMTDRSDVF